MTDQLKPENKLYNKDGEVEWILLRPEEYERLMQLSQAAEKTPPPELTAEKVAKENKAFQEQPKATLEKKPIPPELTAEEVAKENNAFQGQLKAKIEKESRIECPHCGCSLRAKTLESHINKRCPRAPQGIQAARPPTTPKRKKKGQVGVNTFSRMVLNANYLRAQRDSLSD